MVSQIFKDFTLFLDTGKQVGMVSSYKPPSLKVVEESVRLAGMDAPIQVDMGMEPLTTEFVINVNRDVYARFGLITGAKTSLTLRGSTQDTNGLISPMIHKMRGNIRSVEQSEWKTGSLVTMTVMMSLTYFEVSHGIGLPPVIQIDLDNYIRVINGVDQLAATRVAIGR